MKYGLLILLSILFLSARAQEAFYQVNGDMEFARIYSLKDGKARYRKLSNPDGVPFQKELNRILVVFNKNGNYLIPADMETDTSLARKFLEGKPTERLADLVVLTDGKVLAGALMSEGPDQITIRTTQADRSFPFEKVAAIIRKSGSHRLVVAPSAAAEGLRLAQSRITPAILRTQVEVPLSGLALQPASKEFGMPTEPGGLSGKADEKYIDEQLKMDAEAKAASERELEAAAAKAKVPIATKDYEAKVKRKVLELGNYVGVIANAQTDIGQANSAIGQALTLFIDPKMSTVEVAYTGEDNIKIFDIEGYLTRLKLLRRQYQSVKVTWSNISFITELMRGSDGMYHGAVAFDQAFEGFSEGKVVYRDITKKIVAVKLKSYNKLVDGESKEQWDVFLSDIGVRVTRI